LHRKDNYLEIWCNSILIIYAIDKAKNENERWDVLPLEKNDEKGNIWSRDHGRQKGSHDRRLLFYCLMVISW